MRPKWGGRLYFSILAGLFCGLLAWFLGMVLFQLLIAPKDQAYQILVFTLIQAVLFGGVVGGMMSIIEAWWDDSLGAAITSNPSTLLLGCFLGALISLTGHFLGYTFYEDLVPVIGPLGGRLLGFGLAGMIGLISGIHSQSPKRMLNGALGGLLGGLCAGLLYNYLAVYVKVPWISNNTLAFAFPFWAACILLGVGTTEWVASQASLQGTSQNDSPKYRAGFSKLLFPDQRNTIGTSPKCTFKVAMDQYISPLHATITCESGQWWLQPNEDGGLIAINEQEVHQKRQLSNGDALRIGQTCFVFRLK